MNMTEVVLYILLVLAIYPYVIYPVILFILSQFFGNNVDQDDLNNESTVTVIIAAHNEANNIKTKINEVVKEVESVKEVVQIIIVSDYSNDDTFIVSSENSDGKILSIENKSGRGRAGAHNYGVRYATGDILIFTDVATFIPADTYKKIIKKFNNPIIGCVNAEIVYTNTRNSDVSNSAGIYWKYEMWVRKLETRLGLYATSSGPCMALRRELYRVLPPTGDTDFTSPLNIVDSGYRCAHLSGVFAYDKLPENYHTEYKIRVRMVSKNFLGTIATWGVKNLFIRPALSWSIYSHKILKWLSPFFLIGAFVVSFLPPITNIMIVLALLQIVFYTFGLLGFFLSKKNISCFVCTQIYSFLIVNIAFIQGVIKAIFGKAPAYYTPTRGLEK